MHIQLIYKRCLLCGGSQSIVKTSYCASESSYVHLVNYHYYMLVLCKSDVTGVICFNCNDLHVNSVDITAITAQNAQVMHGEQFD